MGLVKDVLSALTTAQMDFLMMVQKLNVSLTQVSVPKISLMMEQEKNVLIPSINAQNLNISATVQEQNASQILNSVLKNGSIMEVGKSV